MIWLSSAQLGMGVELWNGEQAGQEKMELLTGELLVFMDQLYSRHWSNNSFAPKPWTVRLQPLQLIVSGDQPSIWSARFTACSWVNFCPSRMESTQDQ